MLIRRLAAPAVLAALSLAATPAAAAALPTAPHHASAHAVSHYGGGWGWGGGYRYDRYRNRTTAGDVLAGVLILGTIAAVASAASKANQRRSYPQPYPYPNPDRRYDYRPNGPQGIEGAADLCLREVERNARAREVTRVERNADGWLVTGAMADGAAFSCSIGADGRIDHVDVGGRAQAYGAAEDDTDRQYDDDRYRSARADVDAQARAGADAGPQPAYPGGPLPGEDEDGAVEADPAI